MRAFYPSEIVRAADKKAIDEFGIPGIILMENAGRSAAEILRSHYPQAKNFVILCGPGNNGGDGFVLARQLAIFDIHAFIVSTIHLADYQGDALLAARSAVSAGIENCCSQDLQDEEISAILLRADVIVDALLGTGSKGAPRGEVLRLIRLLQTSFGGNRPAYPILGQTPTTSAPANAPCVISLDIPSGIDPDSGEVGESAVSASLTLTFLAPKIGLAVTPGAFHSGAVAEAHIGVPPALLLNPETALHGYDRSDISALQPRVPANAHKGTRGGVLVIGGSVNFRGAPLLAAMASLRAGAGFVFLAVPDFMADAAASSLPEAIILPVPSTAGAIHYEALEPAITPWIDKCDALVLGPGLGRSRDAEQITALILGEWKKPLLLDADALHHLGNLAKTPYHNIRRDDMLITPHAGEAACLLGDAVSDIGSRRLSAVAKLAQTFGPTLLKGPHTLIADGINMRAIMEGSASLAIPGSGDVLSGIAGAYLAAGLSCIDAATLAALVHAEAARFCNRANGILAHELADHITMEGAYL